MADEMNLTPRQRISFASFDLTVALKVIQIIKAEAFVERDDGWADQMTRDDLRDDLEIMGDEVHWRALRLEELLIEVSLNLRRALDEMETRGDGEA